jgi:hypothetical protein
VTSAGRYEGETIYTALLAFQAEGVALQKDALNPHFKSRYLSLDALLGQILPLLNKCGIVLVQAPGSVDGQPVLATALYHVKSGTSVEAGMLLVMDKLTPQGQGAAITYARRYSLMAMLGLVADEDTDGHVTSQEPAQGSTFQGPDGNSYRHDSGGVEGLATDAQLKKLHATIGDLVKLGFDRDALRDGIFADHGIGSTKELTRVECSRVIDTLSKLTVDASAKVQA